MTLKLFLKYAALFVLQIAVLLFAFIYTLGPALAEEYSTVSDWEKYLSLFCIVPLSVAAFDALAYFVLRKERRGCVNILDVTELLVSLRWLLLFAPYPKDYEYAISWLVILLSRVGIIAYRFYMRKQDPEKYPKTPQIDRPIHLQKDKPIQF